MGEWQRYVILATLSLHLTSHSGHYGSLGAPFGSGVPLLKPAECQRPASSGSDHSDLRRDTRATFLPRSPLLCTEHGSSRGYDYRNVSLRDSSGARRMSRSADARPSAASSSLQTLPSLQSWDLTGQGPLYTMSGGVLCPPAASAPVVHTAAGLPPAAPAVPVSHQPVHLAAPKPQLGAHASSSQHAPLPAHMAPAVHTQTYYAAPAPRAAPAGFPQAGHSQPAHLSAPLFVFPSFGNMVQQLLPGPALPNQYYSTYQAHPHQAASYH